MRQHFLVGASDPVIRLLANLAGESGRHPVLLAHLQPPQRSSLLRPRTATFNVWEEKRRHSRMLTLDDPLGPIRVSSSANTLGG